jgi:hypothetical protein
MYLVPCIKDLKLCNNTNILSYDGLFRCSGAVISACEQQVKVKVPWVLIN